MAKKIEVLMPVFEQEYKQNQSRLEQLNEVILRELSHLFKENNIQLGFPIQHRIKTWLSVKEKIGSPRYHIKKSILELQDLVGLRVILPFSRDVLVVKKLIGDSFVGARTLDIAEKLNEDQFGYSSLHLIIHLPDDWLRLPTSKGLEGIQAEIQIRTLSQHMWAEASNILQYKQEASVPRSLLRSINRVSALLEIVDLEFERLLIERENYKKEFISDTGSIQESDEVLNVDSLDLILTDRLPLDNKGDNEEYDILLQDLMQYGYSTQRQLNELIDKALNRVLILDKEKANILIEKLEKRGAPMSHYGARIKNRVFYTFVGLIRKMIKIMNPDKDIDFIDITDIPE